MNINEYFKTPLWSEQKPDFVKSLNKATNKYIKAAKNSLKFKKHIKQFGDFGVSYHSSSLTSDNNFLDFKNYVGQKSCEYLDHQGFYMSKYTTMFTEMWVQEFAKKGGHHPAHVHWNQHVSGFYFLKCSDKTSFPIFHEPRAGARATKLKMKTGIKGVLNGEDLIHFKPQPGSLIIFPGYLEHEFSVDFGIEPFRFIHWNIQAIPKEVAKDVV